jgi:hypothetical protein
VKGQTGKVKKKAIEQQQKIEYLLKPRALKGVLI